MRKMLLFAIIPVLSGCLNGPVREKVMASYEFEAMHWAKSMRYPVPFGLAKDGGVAIADLLCMPAEGVRFYAKGWKYLLDKTEDGKYGYTALIPLWAGAGYPIGIFWAMGHYALHDQSDIEGDLEELSNAARYWRVAHRRVAVRKLARFKSKAVEPLKSVLKTDPDPEIMLEAVMALAWIGDRNDAAPIEERIGEFGTGDNYHFALARLVAGDRAGLKPVVDAASEMDVIDFSLKYPPESDTVALSTENVLAIAASLFPPGVKRDFFVAMTGHKNPAIRAEALLAIGHRYTPKIKTVIAKLADDPDETVRLLARDSLKRGINRYEKRLERKNDIREMRRQSSAALKTIEDEIFRTLRNSTDTKRIELLLAKCLLIPHVYRAEIFRADGGFVAGVPDGLKPEKIAADLAAAVAAGGVKDAAWYELAGYDYLALPIPDMADAKAAVLILKFDFLAEN